ncbi:PaaI family thioesterase [Methylovirgula sp. 4M-Z18]|uniref:PaaI family thioesterase n=1 Tax=Methylovirgula sp. 4M-Z18 TaxID=2293567 RepID=UPI001FE021A0|nr:PaaI family thioesterase [Methylovirgula sp. 4M-Z18]
MDARSIPPGRMTADEITALLDREFPQLLVDGRSYVIEAADHGFARMRLCYHARHLRPGGTISGPSMFALADLCLYVAILASIGPVVLTVTTNLNINFMRKPAPADLVGTCRLLKLGKRQAVGEVAICPEGSEDLVAHATGTYALPE